MRQRWIAGLALVAVLLALGLATTPEARAQLRATRTPTRTPTPAGTQTLTPTATPTLARRQARPTATPTLPLLVILPAPSVKEGLAGDVFAPPGLAISAAYPAVFGDRIAFGMVNLVETAGGAYTESGVESVGFTIVDLISGDVVFTVERRATDRFCAFGGEPPACAVWDFGAQGDVWPSGQPTRSGRYVLIATARGSQPERQGTWTLAFEVRLAQDGLQALDGAARIRSMTQSAREVRLTVETFGFTPLALGTHLHIYTDLLREEEAAGGAAGVLEYPAEGEVVPAYGIAEVVVPARLIPQGARAVCVALAHPDHSVLAGRGDCAALRGGY